MKKTLLKLLSLSLVLLMLVGSLSSCMKAALAVLGEENDARLLLYSLQTAGGKSYTITTESKLTVTVGKTTNSVTSAGEFTEYKIGSKDYRYHMDMTTETVLGGKYTKMETLKGFQNGRMYSGYDQAADSGYVFSEISRKDYEEHMEEMDMRTTFSFDINKDNCSEITCVKNDDKTRTATFSGFTSSGLEQFFELMDIAPDTFGDGMEIEDICMTLTVDKKLRPETLRLDLIFDVSDEFEGTDPTMYLEMSFDLDDVEAPADMDFSDYTEVEDLRLADRVEKQLKEMTDKEEGYFTTQINAKVTAASQTQNENTLYTGSYTNEDGSYTHEIKVTDKNKLYRVGTISYKDGKQEAGGMAASMEKSMTDASAKAFLGSLLNPSNFNAASVSRITPVEGEEGVYLITLADPKSNHSVASSLGMDVTSSLETLKVTIKDGELVACEHYLFIRGTIAKVSISYTVTTTSTYLDEPAEN